MLLCVEYEMKFFKGLGGEEGRVKGTHLSGAKKLKEYKWESAAVAFTMKMRKFLK